MIRKYNRKLLEKEKSKNGVRKKPITKERVCKEILKDMRSKGLLT